MLTIALIALIATQLVLLHRAQTRSHTREDELIKQITTMKIEPQVLVHRQMVEDLPEEPAFISPFDDEGMAEHFDARTAGVDA